MAGLKPGLRHALIKRRDLRNYASSSLPCKVEGMHFHQHDPLDVEPFSNLSTVLICWLDGRKPLGL